MGMSHIILNEKGPNSMNPTNSMNSPNARKRRISAPRALALTGILAGGAAVAFAAGFMPVTRAAAPAATPAAIPAATPAPTKTTEDGVYSDAQATRGKAQYTQSCATCHMDDLSGSGQAPPLAGDAFSSVWDGHTVSELFDLTRTTMPQDNPGSLTPDQYVDIITYLFKANNLPSGKDDLKSDPDTLKGITITQKKAGS
jgi:S-disulfanyl-L-cysteine oxidoreductase SoxD